MNLKSNLLLFGACVSAVGATGCIFELAYGMPKFGFTTNWILLAVSIPVTVLFFIGAVKEARANSPD